MPDLIQLSTLPLANSGIVAAISDNMFWFASMVVGIVAIVFVFVSLMVNVTSRERTRREVAAYVAEGSMTDEQAEQLLTAKLRR